MSHPTRRAVLAGTLATLAACHGPGARRAPLAAEVYVWRRAWDPATTTLVRQACASWDRVYALASELDPHGIATTLPVPWPLLTATPVLRLARLDQLDPATLAPHLRPLLHLPARAVQIDVDAPTASLPELADRLTELTRAHPDTAWEITGLPTWLRSPALPRLLRPLRRWTLQTHATELPRTPDEARLMPDRPQVEAWIRAASALRHPFALALPTYAYGMAFDRTGRFLGLEAERTRDWPPGHRIVEVWPPHDWLPSLVADLRARAPAAMQAVTWFRLPLPGDRRVWSTEALERARVGSTLRAEVVVALRAREGGVADVVVRGVGDVPVRVAGEVRVSGAVTAAEGVGGFVWVEGGFRGGEGEVLAVGEERVVGWVRGAGAVEWVGR